MEKNKQIVLEKLRQSDPHTQPINMGDGLTSIHDEAFRQEGALLDNFINIIDTNPKESIDLLHSLNPADTALIAENLATKKAIDRAHRYANHYLLPTRKIFIASLTMGLLLWGTLSLIVTPDEVLKYFQTRQQLFHLVVLLPACLSCSLLPKMLSVRHAWFKFADLKANDELGWLIFSTFDIAANLNTCQKYKREEIFQHINQVHGDSHGYKKDDIGRYLDKMSHVYKKNIAGTTYYFLDLQSNQR